MFKLTAEYSPSGDQIEAIKKLTQGVFNSERMQVLLGVTGSGKTFTMANVINNVQKSALIITHNKTLAAQLCNEFRELFPQNRVEYFVSYYDYYQPEAYIPRSDTYIEKEVQINEEIDKLRHSTTSSLGEKNKVIVVASVSCIYGLGAPKKYFENVISIRQGAHHSRNEIIDKLVSNQYKRNDIGFTRATFRVRGDVLEIFPAYSSKYFIRVDFFDDYVENIYEIEDVTLRRVAQLSHVAVFPASHYVIGGSKVNEILAEIYSDMEKQEEYFKNQGKLIEAQRIREKVSYNVEMIREMGFCPGIENYSRYFDGRKPGEPPFTLLDYFPDDFLLFIDESHIAIPQIRGMYLGDKSRKENLVDFGFRLPAAYDNRPLNFNEFNARIKQMICVSATPAEYEMKKATTVAEQLLRPTGLVDPEITVKGTHGQIDDLISEINVTIKNKGRVLVTTLTKKMAENLTVYLKEKGIKVEYIHSEIDTLERINIITRLRKGEMDVLVGINLLREGLDIPEVQLVAILDADKEGFLRSKTSLVQIIGRSARNKDARVIMYADQMTKSMQDAISETDRRRDKQLKYNLLHNIEPKTIIKPIKNTISITSKPKLEKLKKSPKEIYKEIESLYAQMAIASDSYDFETAIILRDKINELRNLSKNKKGPF